MIHHQFLAQLSEFRLCDSSLCSGDGESETGGGVGPRSSNRLRTGLQMPSQRPPHFSQCQHSHCLQGSNLFASEVSSEPTHWSYSSFVLRCLSSHPQAPIAASGDVPSLADGPFPHQNRARCGVLYPVDSTGFHQLVVRLQADAGPEA